MLKYNNSVIKPVQLFNHADLVTIRSNAEAARNAYSSLSQSSTSSTMSTPFRSAVKPPTPPSKPPSDYGATSTIVSQPQLSSNKSPSKGHSNPYARPLSAKDIVNDFQNQKTRKPPSAAQNTSGNNTLQNDGSGATTYGFQMNAFMRPQSAIKKDYAPAQQKVTSRSTTKPNESRDNDATDSYKSDNSKTIKKVVPPTRLEREVDLSETLGSSASTTSISGKRNQFGPAKRDSSSVTQSSTGSSNTGSTALSKVTSSSQTTEVKSVTKTVTKMTDTSTNTTSKTVIYAKPMSSLPRPGSQAPRSNSSTPDSQHKVRNLNYTPTKPYSEVMDPSPVNTASKSVVTDKPPISATTKTIQTTETSITKGTTYVAPSNIGKAYDKHNSNSSIRSSASSSNTVYYRKVSKGEVVLHEQRPPVVGAAAQPVKGIEKDVAGPGTGLGSDIEEEDDESENGTPSG